MERTGCGRGVAVEDSNLTTRIAGDDGIRGPDSGRRTFATGGIEGGSERDDVRVARVKTMRARDGSCDTLR